MRNTPNYNLPQYDGTDKFTKEILNDAFSKIDSAVNDLQETFNVQNDVNIDSKIIAEVINARGGKESLGEKIYEIDEMYNDTVAQINTINTRCDDIVNDKIPSIKEQLDSVEAKLNRCLDISDYRQYVVNDDWKPALLKAIEDSNKIKFPKGIYKMSYVEIPSSVEIYGDGDETVFIPLGSVLFGVIGSRENKISISEDVEYYSNSIKVPNTLMPNDFICLRGVRDALNEADSGESWCLGYATPNSQGLIYGEFLEVESATANEITTKHSTIFPWYNKNSFSNDTSLYKRPNSTIEKINFAKDVILRDFKVIGIPNTCINVDFGYNVKVENVIQDATGYTDGVKAFITFRRSLMCEAVNCLFKIDNVISPSDHYYVNVYKIIGSQDCTFDNCKAFNTTQAFDITYISSREPNSETEFSMPSINSTIKNCYSKNAQQTGMTAHQGTYITSFINNNIVGSKQGIYARSKNSVITGNTINNKYVKSSTSYGIGIGESNATNSVITNNNISDAYTGILVTDGVSEGSCWKYCGLVISNNTILNFVTGIHIKKGSPYVDDDMFININNNNLYSTKTLEGVSLRGINIGQGANFITIKDNVISLRLYNDTSYGIYLDYDSNDIEIFNNKIRKCKLGIYHRRLSADSTLARVEISDIGNSYIGCESEHNLISALIRRVNNQNMSYVNLDSVSSLSTPRENGSLFIISTSSEPNGKLYYIDKNGTRFKLAIDTTLEV